jgi:valyl-tRNA synthetase
MLESGCIYSERELINKCTVHKLTVIQSEVENTIKKLVEYSELIDKVKFDKIQSVLR